MKIKKTPCHLRRSATPFIRTMRLELSAPRRGRPCFRVVCGEAQISGSSSHMGYTVNSRDALSSPGMSGTTMVRTSVCAQNRS